MKKLNKKLTVLLLAIALIVTGSTAWLVLAATLENAESELDQQKNNSVNDYTSTNPNITGVKPTLEEMELAKKEWFEYVEYEFYMEDSSANDGYIYRIYTPTDYSRASVMAIRDYNPDEKNVSGSTVDLGITWGDLLTTMTMISVANSSVIVAGGVQSGVSGMVGQNLVALIACGLFTDAGDVLKNAPYYSSPDFMGIQKYDENGKPVYDWNGVSKTGFYNADSITIQMEASNSVSVAKTNTLNSGYTTGGSTEGDAGVDFLWVKASVNLGSNASSELGYGVDFQQNQSIDNSYAVSRTFNARTDEEVKNVAWKLCEYKVVTTYMVEVVSEEDGGVVAVHYLEQDLLKGVCRVFANGYIEHWNTGELVNYATFFEGFLTATELVADAKKEMGGNQ